MTQEMTILTFYEVDKATREQLEAIYPRLRIYHTPRVKDMEPWIEEADIVMSLNFSDELLERAHKLRWLQAVGAGINHLLTPDFIKSDVVLTNAKGNHTVSVSEHAFALLLALSRHIYRCYGEDNVLLRWEREPAGELYDKTMGVLGLGNIGREIVRKAKAFGMKVRGYDVVPVFVPYLDELYLSDQIEEFFSGLDVIVVAAALTSASRGMVNRHLISLMNEGSYLVNVARGPLVVEEDLIDALKNGPLAAAGLDVFEVEPLPMDNELRRLSNVVLTPHIAGLNPRYEERIFRLFVENFKRWMNEEPLVNFVDKQVAS